MKFNVHERRFEGCTNYGVAEVEDLIVNLDDDLIPVSVEYDQVVPKEGAELTITVAGNGFIISDNMDCTTHVVESSNKWRLSDMLESLMWHEQHFVKPFVQKDWDTNFTELALQELSKADHAGSIAMEVTNNG